MKHTDYSAPIAVWVKGEENDILTYSLQGLSRGDTVQYSNKTPIKTFGNQGGTGLW